MHQLFAVGIMFALCGLVSGQNSTATPGTFGQPFAPRISTPSASPDALVTPTLTLDTPALAVGASATMNATGASGAYVNQPLWYEPGVQISAQEYESPFGVLPASEAKNNFAAGSATPAAAFNSGAATFESSIGAAQLMTKPGRKATRTYTNPDVRQVNGTNGTVKYAGKLAHLD
jgi:hypothetical protein